MHNSSAARNANMKFRIYLRRFGKLIKLYKLHRNNKGLYIFSSRNKGYVSYHEDGKYWIREKERKLIKKIRQSLSSFKGVETLENSVWTILGPMSWDRDENPQHLLSEDIVIDLDGIIGIEIIISDNAITLPTLPERINSITYIKQCRPPFLIIETYQLTSNILQPSRFPSDEKWVEGKNFFYNHTGRI
jgi:hypothetical protein